MIGRAASAANCPEWVQGAIFHRNVIASQMWGRAFGRGAGSRGAEDVRYASGEAETAVESPS